MISVEQLTVSFGGFDLFKDITFLINKRDRIGLTGRNGAGKSTLLKILAKEQEASSGAVIIPADCTVGYLPQHMITAEGRTVMEEATSAFDEILQLEKEIEHLNHQLATRDDYESAEYTKIIEQVTEKNDRFAIIGSGNFEAEIEQTLIGLGFKRSDFTRQTTEFSGGWRMRVELAKILLLRPDIFLLDEPTNHLDIESIEWLENFLATYTGAVVLVSHDLAFIDNITNRTVEISMSQIYDYKANYSNYLILRKERREQQMAAYVNQQKMIQDTEKFIERFRYQATKSVQVQSRIKHLNKIVRIEVDAEDNRALSIKFPPAPRSGTTLVEAKSLSKSFGDLNVLDNIDFTLERGDKVAFVGKNGEGKTTLARIIMQEIEHDGDLKLGHNLELGYFAQNQASLLDENRTVFDTIDSIAVGDMRTKVRDILGAFMFGGADIDKKVKVLSGGERTRLAMIKLLLEPVNFLVLDEPTNHLDLKSKEILKEALQNFDGTLIIVSHDRDFLDGLVNCVYEFKDKKMKQHLGGVYNFLERRKLEGLRELTTASDAQKEALLAAKAEAKESKGSAKASVNYSYEEKKEISKLINRLTKIVDKREEEVFTLEGELEKLDQIMLDDPAKGADQAFLEIYSKTKEKLEESLSDWESKGEELEVAKANKVW